MSSKIKPRDAHQRVVQRMRDQFEKASGQQPTVQAQREIERKAERLAERVLNKRGGV